ncbi:hypothetical protein K7432_012247 [Basidiobolus ranarum]|uniref:Uncharacterized protein n=1 Tax=Basidiobolus ranarum TaxID=34480 RepID=A0ABR2WL84_9FUNG
MSQSVLGRSLPLLWLTWYLLCGLEEVCAGMGHIVVFKKSLTMAKSNHFTWLASKSNSTNSMNMRNIGDFQWYSGELQTEMLSKLKEMPEVEYIIPDLPVHTCDVQNKPPNWGLDRIDQQLGTDGQFRYPASSGKGVTIYVIDTGVNVDHLAFEGRATWGPTLNGDPDGTDRHGHGTFIAGVAIGKTFGVAKQANLVSIKALNADGSGRLSDVLRGVEWIVKEHLKNPGQKSIVNLSLSADFSQAANDAIEEAIELGIHFSIAAGNDGNNACRYSPSSVSQAVVVGAIDRSDRITGFSNYGSCVSIYAPGTDIVSAWKTGPQSSHSLSGTSMATPHVTGTMALILGEKDWDPATLKSNLLKQGVKFVQKGPELRPILYMGSDQTLGAASKSEASILIAGKSFVHIFAFGTLLLYTKLIGS